MNDPGKTLGRFWHNCFEAAFEELASEDQAVKKAALEEIAKLTVNVFDVDEDFEKLVRYITQCSDSLYARVGDCLLKPALSCRRTLGYW